MRTVNGRTSRQLRVVFDRLAAHFGPLHWWPAQTPFEVVVGAVLTQNTAWRNVEYAIANLRAGVERRFGGLTLRGFVRLDNLFDRQYVGSVIVGDSNGRYYESAPGRNWLAGVSARYNF